MKLFVVAAITATLCLVLLLLYRLPMTMPALRYLTWQLTQGRSGEHGYVTLKDCRIYYEVHGSGAPVILLHGGLTSVAAWFAELPLLAKQFRVVAIDLRGHGRSTLGDQPFTYRLLAEDIVRVMQALDVPSAHIVGWSDGGNVGLTLAVYNPQRVRRLITLGANYHPDGLTVAAQQSLAAATPANHPFMTRLWYQWLSPDPDDWETLWHRTTTMWRNYPHLSRQDLATIKSPTLIVQGEFDTVSIEHSRAMVSAIANAKLVIIPGEGHNLLFDAPDQIAEIIDNFLVQR